MEVRMYLEVTRPEEQLTKITSIVFNACCTQLLYICFLSLASCFHLYNSIQINSTPQILFKSKFNVSSRYFGLCQSSQ